MKPSLPPKLYKYQPYNVQTLDNLKDRILWFSKPAQFNDPFDCNMTPSEIEEMSEKDWQDLYSGMINAAQASNKVPPSAHPDKEFRTIARKGFRKSFEEIAAKIQHQGIACFSTKMDDLLMWSHYADGHRGFCLEFDGTYPPFSRAKPVLYTDTVPTLNPAEVAEVWVKSNPDPLVKFLLTKSSCWSYEQEWRALHPEGNAAYQYEAAALSGIYLGCEMRPIHQEVIARLLAGFPAHLYEMGQSGTKFKLEWQQIK